MGKKLILAAALLSLATPAFAADIIAPAPVVKAPIVPAPIFSWTGFYIGAHGGGAWSKWTGIDPTDPAATWSSVTASGGIVGGQIGGNYQISNFVVGLEGTGAWSSVTLNAGGPFGGGAGFNLSLKNDYIATVAGRFGVAFDRVLLYAKGGAAFTRDKYSANNGLAGALAGSANRQLQPHRLARRRRRRMDVHAELVGAGRVQLSGLRQHHRAAGDDGQSGGHARQCEAEHPDRHGGRQLSLLRGARPGAFVTAVPHPEAQRGRSPRGRARRPVVLTPGSRLAITLARASAGTRVDAARKAVPVKSLRQLLTGEDVIQLVIRLGLLALLILWTLLIIRPFVPILAWSGVLAVAFYPAFSWVAKVLGGRPRTAAAILTLITLGIVIGPATWLGVSAVDGVQGAGAPVQHRRPRAPVGAGADQVVAGDRPALYELWDQAYNNIRAVLREVAPYLQPLAGPLLSLAGDASLGTLQFLVSVFVAGFLFPHGPRLVAAGRGFLFRIVPEQSEHFLGACWRDHPRRGARRDRRRHRAGAARRHRLQARSRAERRPARLHRAAAVDRADRRLPRAAAGDHLDLDRQGRHHGAAAHRVPRPRRLPRHHVEAARHGARPDHADHRDLRRRDRRHARPRHRRPVHRADHPVGGLGDGGGLDPDRGPRRGGEAECDAASERVWLAGRLQSAAGTSAAPRMRVDNDGSRRYPGVDELV